MFRRTRLFVPLALLLVLTATLVIASPAVMQDDDDTVTATLNTPVVAVTVYNQGTALVQDRRVFDLQSGLNTVNFTDVAAAIDATSVSFTSITDPEGTVVLEQNYVYDLVSIEALLARYIDQTITVTGQPGAGGEPATFTGQLLSARGGQIVLRTEDGQIVALVAGAQDVRFPELPEGLITRPTLRWIVSSAQDGPQEVELTYLTGGMNWSADYILLLGTDENSLDLNGWVTLNNTSGASYRDALLKLVAGDVNRVQPNAPVPSAGFADDMEMLQEERGATQREFFEYQLYEINRRVTIGNNETKQIEFVSGTGIATTTYFVFQPTSGFVNYGSPIIDQGYGQFVQGEVGTWLEFSTGPESGLDADLPAGRIRVYQEDADGAALLIGENYIDHTPNGETVGIYLGNAFDLVGERVQTGFELVGRDVIRESFEIRLRNRKDDETVQIRVPESLFRWTNWEILSSSLPYEQLDAFTIEFRADVPPGEEIVLSYTVEYRLPR
jgi:hypothetical protein